MGDAWAILASGGDVTVSISDISCPDNALDIDEGGGTLKAIDCNITGKIGKGVIVTT